MAFLFGLFSKKKTEDDYETILSTLALDIQKRQQQLAEIRLRERRATLLVTMYTLGGWVAYICAWYLGLFSRGTGLEKALKAFPVLLGPIGILFIRRIVQVWYANKGDAEERTLRELLKNQRVKVEEIKKKTNYYSTRDLLQRYDEQGPSDSPLRTPQRNQPPPKSSPNANANGTPQTPSQSQLQPPSPPQPQRKMWFDKLADAVLGDDDAADQARYALICENCFSHNGLVKESVWEETQYVCPKCQHFNPSKMAKRLGIQGPLSPSKQGIKVITPTQHKSRGAQPPPQIHVSSPKEKEKGTEKVQGESMEVDS